MLKEINRYSDERTCGQVHVAKAFVCLAPASRRDFASFRSCGSHRCISGFPNQTYRGSQALTRYEFAAGLNSCLNQIERLIASPDTVSGEDLSTIQRLNEEFAVELASIKGRVDSLSDRTAVLEDNQFFTTTKLVGNVWFNITGAGAGLDVDPNDGGLNDSYSHTLGFNFDWAIASKFGIFARYTYASIVLQPIDISLANTSLGFGDLEFAADGDNTVISALDTDLAVLVDLEPSHINESDFAFA